ncbi:MAG: winged helix-turn-helix domain-containing protein [Xanthomonadales bacterium]|jgi:DNA-binding winged helix-turn-helix (wHTH) protein/lipoprotein NlpI|nr:winged helix-turn-helix domain-containing protein [Xanthomonadales bacterium]
MSGDSVFRFGPFTLDRRRRRLCKGETPIRLKPKEWELLCCLVDQRDRVLSKDELLDQLWPRQTVTEANLSQTVYAVRKALGESARQARWIETVPRLGYRFVASAPAGGRGTPSPESSTGAVPASARAAYERGRYCWRRFTTSSLKQALAFFDEALEAAPRFAEAHAWRSATWSALGNIGALSPRESAEHARRAADQAITIDDSLATGYEMRGVVELYFDWNFEAARRSFDKAIERDAGSANAHHLRANALAFCEEFEAAHADIEQAQALDPTSLITRTDAGLFHYLERDFEAAQTCLEAVLRQDPTFAHARVKLAHVLATRNQPADALRQCELAAEDLRDGVTGTHACMLGLAGRPDEARAMLSELIDDVSLRSADPYGMALAYLGLGEEDNALDALALALEYRSRNLVTLRSDPTWDALRSRGSFKELLASVAYR